MGPALSLIFNFSLKFLQWLRVQSSPAETEYWISCYLPLSHQALRESLSGTFLMAITALCPDIKLLYYDQLPVHVMLSLLRLLICCKYREEQQHSFVFVVRMTPHFIFETWKSAVASRPRRLRWGVAREMEGLLIVRCWFRGRFTQAVEYKTSDLWTPNAAPRRNEPTTSEAQPTL